MAYLGIKTDLLSLTVLRQMKTLKQFAQGQTTRKSSSQNLNLGYLPAKCTLGHTLSIHELILFSKHPLPFSGLYLTSAYQALPLYHCDTH